MNKLAATFRPALRKTGIGLNVEQEGDKTYITDGHIAAVFTGDAHREFFILLKTVWRGAGNYSYQKFVDFVRPVADPIGKLFKGVKRPVVNTGLTYDFMPEKKITARVLLIDEQVTLIDSVFFAVLQQMGSPLFGSVGKAGPVFSEGADFSFMAMALAPRPEALTLLKLAARDIWGEGLDA